MGLAAYGGPQINWETWLHTQADSTSLSISAYDIFLEVAALEKRYDQGHGKPYFRPWLVDPAYKVQAELEDALTHIVATAQAETGLNKLCLAGGVALNSVANYQVLMRCKLDDIFIFQLQPTMASLQVVRSGPTIPSAAGPSVPSSTSQHLAEHMARMRSSKRSPNTTI